MNTPKTKSPTRFKHNPSKHRQPVGNFTSGIHNPEIAARLGELITFWPHVEEQMIHIFGELIGIADHILKRQTFRSIVNQKLRIDLMRTMLEQSPVHMKSDVFYDEVIAELTSLNKARNTYAHSLWWTKDDDLTVFIHEQVAHPYSFMDGREVKAMEILAVRDRMVLLIRKIVKHYFDRRRAAPGQVIKVSKPAGT
jgi:hypothetical protein